MCKIAHISDIHIRSLSRHSEYKRVFADLLEEFKSLRVDHVFIGGDIFHTKLSGISPEYIDLMYWWLTEMAKLVKVHMILGNHDGLLTNLSRQDAISPIVNAINSPNIFLYKTSGVYEFAPGFNWCVFSIFDVEGWKNVYPEKDKVNIACYHGPVWGAVTEVGWDIEGDMRVDDFKDYDFAFLGDIHQFQYLDYKEVELEIDECDLKKYPDAVVVEE